MTSTQLHRHRSPDHPAPDGSVLHPTAGTSALVPASAPVGPGLPVDVAETTARLAHPALDAVDDQAAVRVCGQSLLGA